jgi:hypothetical protein
MEKQMKLEDEMEKMRQKEDAKKAEEVRMQEEKKAAHEEEQREEDAKKAKALRMEEEEKAAHEEKQREEDANMAKALRMEEEEKAAQEEKQRQEDAKVSKALRMEEEEKAAQEKKKFENNTGGKAIELCSTAKQLEINENDIMTKATSLTFELQEILVKLPDSDENKNFKNEILKYLNESVWDKKMENGKLDEMDIGSDHEEPKRAEKGTFQDPDNFLSFCSVSVLCFSLIWFGFRTRDLWLRNSLMLIT